MPRRVHVEGYTLLRRLGAGRTGVTYLAVDKRSKAQVAIKTIERGARVDDCIEHEVLIHASLDHPHIVRFHRLECTTNHLGLVMEACKGGDLFEFVDAKRADLLNESLAWRMLYELLTAVEYLHARRVYHRDIKPENVLLTVAPTSTANVSRTHLKLCDFGFAIRDDGHSPLDAVGTTAYAPPEVFDEDQVRYDLAAADVWSCTVIFYVLLRGTLPFQDPDEFSFVNLRRGSSVSTWHRDVVSRVMACRWNPIPDGMVSGAAVSLLRKVFVRDPQKRPRLGDLLRICRDQVDPPGDMRLVASVPAMTGPAHGLLERTSQTEAELVKLLHEAKQGPASSDASSQSSPVNASNPHLMSALMARMNSGVRESHSSPQLDQLATKLRNEPEPKSPIAATSTTAARPPRAPRALHRVGTAGDDLNKLFQRGLTFERTNRPDQAVVLYRAAAEQGHPDAQFTLGHCYELGRGVPRDSTVATDWYARAATRGNTEARRRLAHIRSPVVGSPLASEEKAQSGDPRDPVDATGSTSEANTYPVSVPTSAPG